MSHLIKTIFLMNTMYFQSIYFIHWSRSYSSLEIKMSLFLCPLVDTFRGLIVRSINNSKSVAINGGTWKVSWTTDIVNTIFHRATRVLVCRPSQMATIPMPGLVYVWIYIYIKCIGLNMFARERLQTSLIIVHSRPWKKTGVRHVTCANIYIF